ncbi:hypothetical protein DPMN_000747 [Dreissena polymorpha]|uniref:Uncharacterized protein n=1 Tax=Dreissena polymorpha TaxID=45954 RepID=A0A9D4MIR9_DREPO|nr:hypothetical protein DPMN_000747 [Dreissena polymorpha]
MKEVFPEPPLLAFRMYCNLQDILVHKKHNRMFFQKPNMTADYFIDYSGKKYSVRNNVLCKSSNVVYAVNCRRCCRYMYVYVGETSGTLYQRHLLNLSRIRTQHSDPVPEHFHTDGHSMDDFRIMGLEKPAGRTSTARPLSNCGKQNKTIRPYGINVQEHCVHTGLTELCTNAKELWVALLLRVKSASGSRSGNRASDNQS